MSSKQKLVLYLCYAVSLGYAANKFVTTIGLWFHGVTQWEKLWRPFPDWGQGADLYGALLAAKWNGTRMLWYGMLLLGMTFFVMLYKKYKFLAFLLFQGALVELLNLLWVANAKSNGWSTPASNEFMVESALWAGALFLSGLYLFTQPAAEGGEAMPDTVGVTPGTHKLLIRWCAFVALVFSAMKLYFAYYWWLSPYKIWAVGFRMFPDWGTGGALYGALLPAKWIFSSNFCYGAIIALAVYYGHKFNKFQFLGFLLLQGVFIEFFDGFWLANGKFNEGWTKFGDGLPIPGQMSMIGGFIWGPILLTCAIYLLSKEFLEARQTKN
jgi:hypothetical protein